jgi:hypothetical protein
LLRYVGEKAETMSESKLILNLPRCSILHVKKASEERAQPSTMLDAIETARSPAWAETSPPAREGHKKLMAAIRTSNSGKAMLKITAL